MIEAFDVAVIEFMGQFTARSPRFDQTVNIIRDSNLLKGGILVAMLWWCWARKGFASPDGVERATRIIVAAVMSIAVGRALQLLLPFRSRPLHDPEMSFTPPHGLSDQFLDGWSSFPSDHAILFFGLTVAIWSYHRPTGMLALLWTLVVICLPRLYSGVHYLTDLAAGGLIGAGIMLVALRMPLRRGWGDWFRHHPAWTHALLFLATFQLAELFRGMRDVVGWSAQLVGLAGMH